MNDTPMPRRQSAFRDDFRLRIARLYNGPLHVLMIYAIGVATIWYCARQVQGPAWYEWLIVPVTFLAGNVFEWTYEGDGPRQLAMAILADHLGDDLIAMDHCEKFMIDVVANLDNYWRLTSDDIDKAIRTTS